MTTLVEGYGERFSDAVSTTAISTNKAEQTFVCSALFISYCAAVETARSLSIGLPQGRARRTKNVKGLQSNRPKPAKRSFGYRQLHQNKKSRQTPALIFSVYYSNKQITYYRHTVCHTGICSFGNRT